jgi:hypothetical protein
MRFFQIGFVLAALMLPTLVHLSPASAESGNSGGRIGDDGKSVSGTSTRQPKPAAPQQQKQKQPEATSSTPCNKLVGQWLWYGGASNVTFRRDGSAQLSTRRKMDLRR